jgi:hypothetical protein
MGAPDSLSRSPAPTLQFFTVSTTRYARPKMIGLLLWETTCAPSRDLGREILIGPLNTLAFNLLSRQPGRESETDGERSIRAAIPTVCKPLAALSAAVIVLQGGMVSSSSSPLPRGGQELHYYSCGGGASPMLRLACLYEDLTKKARYFGAIARL